MREIDTGAVGVKELTKQTAQSMGISQRQAKKIIKAFLQTLGEQIAEKGKVRLSKIGVFEKKICRGKVVRDPQGRDGRKYEIPDYQKVRFTAFKNLKQKIRTE